MVKNSQNEIIAVPANSPPPIKKPKFPYDYAYGESIKNSLKKFFQKKKKIISQINYQTRPERPRLTILKREISLRRGKKKKKKAKMSTQSK